MRISPENSTPYLVVSLLASIRSDFRLSGPISNVFRTGRFYEQAFKIPESIIFLQLLESSSILSSY